MSGGLYLKGLFAVDSHFTVSFCAQSIAYVLFGDGFECHSRVRISVIILVCDCRTVACALHRGFSNLSEFDSSSWDFCPAMLRCRDKNLSVHLHVHWSVMRCAFGLSNVLLIRRSVTDPMSGRIDTTRVGITLVDANNMPPTFPQRVYDAEVYEGTPIGTIVRAPFVYHCVCTTAHTHTPYSRQDL